MANRCVGSSFPAEPRETVPNIFNVPPVVAGGAQSRKPDRPLRSWVVRDMLAEAKEFKGIPDQVVRSRNASSD